MEKKLKIGVLGAGHLGMIHLKLLKEIPAYTIMGFYDPDMQRSVMAQEEHSVNSFKSMKDLVEHCDVVDVVTPTLSHYECAALALRKSKHVFIEKPLTNTLSEARKLSNLAREANTKVQVGHVERFNPAFLAAQKYCGQPLFIEAHRLAQFNPRGTDVPVVLDLMIHDIDIILNIVKANIRRISASGVAVVSDSPDIANARIEFDNGCVANLTASRISMKNMRKTRIFQRDAYIAIDFLKKKTDIIRLSTIDGEPDPDTMFIDLGFGKGKKAITFEAPEVPDTNAIKMELEAFADAINNNTTPIVTIDDGFKALEVAYKIIDKFHISHSLLK